MKNILTINGRNYEIDSYYEFEDILRKQLESSDLLIGHAYFIGKNKDDLANILNRNIIPLLYEYFYDNEKKVKDALAKAIEGTDVKINETIRVLSYFSQKSKKKFPYG